MDEDVHEWYAREGSSSLRGPNGDRTPGGGNLESIHDYYGREGSSCPVSPLDADRWREERLRHIEDLKEKGYMDRQDRVPQEKSKNEPIETKVEPPHDLSIKSKSAPSSLIRLGGCCRLKPFIKFRIDVNQGDLVRLIFKDGELAGYVQNIYSDPVESRCFGTLTTSPEANIGETEYEFYESWRQDIGYEILRRNIGNEILRRRRAMR